MTDFKSKKILMVEDDTLIGQMFKTKLESTGAQVTWALNGEDGVRKLKKEKVDLIITDILMPKMNGFEFIEHVRGNPETANIPVMILTNLTDRPEDAKRVKKMGILDYIIKSNMQLKDIVGRVGAILEQEPKKKVEVKRD